MAKVIATDSNGNPVSLNDVNLEEGLTIDDINKDLEWVLTTKDTTPAIYNTDHIGGRPDDR